MESGGHIFLIEDEFVINRLIAFGLRNLGYEVQTVYTGGAALRRLSEADFDQAVLDMDLPEVDGQRVLTQFADKAALTKVILISGEEAYFLKYPQATRCLEKPSDIRKLQKVAGNT